MGWLEHCISNHSECGSGQEKPLPTRVLDIGSLEEPSLRVYETQGEKGQYACLSHCWGIQNAKSPMLRTTTSTLRSFKDRIPPAALPRSFQDAVFFARRLGLRWIWIDSLCIIQDDVSDWQKEAAQMASIYQNSYITVAATAASSSDGGCFTRPYQQSYHPHKLIVTDLNENAVVIYARLWLPHIFVTRDKDDFPLLKRAWVHQERLLSPRVLHFAGYELNWECRETSACECGSATTSTVHPKTDYARRSSQRGASNVSSFESESWRRLTRRYMQLGLTYTKDIFPALSGLAKQLNSGAHDQYLAGLWRKALIPDLLWYTLSYHPRPAQWRAPTWSWASVIAPGDDVAQDKNKLDVVYAEVIKAECTPAGPDYTGELASAYLILSSKAVVGTIYWNLTKENSGKASSIEPRPSYHLVINAVKYFFRLDYPIWEDGPGHLESESSVQVLCIGGDRKDGSMSRLACLILRSDPTEAWTFQRIGYVSIQPSLIIAESMAEVQADPDSLDGESLKSCPALNRRVMGLFDAIPENKFKIL